MMTNQEFSQLRKPLALIVDDEPLILMDTADILAAEGYHVVEAATADEAYAYLLRHHLPKLLMTDIQMPGVLDGLSLAEKVSENWPEIQIIIVSGAIRPNPTEIPTNARFLAKPVSEQDIRKLLGKRGV